MSRFLSFLDTQTDCSHIILSFIPDDDLIITIRRLNRAVSKKVSYLQACFCRSRLMLKKEKQSHNLTWKWLNQVGVQLHDDYFDEAMEMTTDHILSLESAQLQIEFVKYLEKHSTRGWLIDPIRLCVNTAYVSVVTFILNHEYLLYVYDYEDILEKLDNKNYGLNKNNNSEYQTKREMILAKIQETHYSVMDG